MRSQKKATAAARAEWAKAVKEHRVLRFETGTLKSYLTVAMRDDAILDAALAGIRAEIVL